MDSIVTCDCKHIIGDHDEHGCHARTCRCSMSRDHVLENTIRMLQADDRKGASLPTKTN